ncbi:MAG: autotransporter-associated beta strand repeat-containing protein [Verrucomicrobiae bacterium]|nr:autotransporter-associated beta strand repeat-containing protein [Verrucomicrobiae bacterium]
MKIKSFTFPKLSVCAAILGAAQLAGAASATWLAAPSNNNWIAAPTTNNWSTGVGTFPGATSGTSSADVASFTNKSTITTINCASAFVVNAITFDSTNCSAYTINTSGGTWRVSGAGIHVTGTVTNKQTITGQLRMGSGATLNVTSDSTTPSATLNLTGGIAVNNTAVAGSTLVLGGTNVGLNILASYTENTAANAIGNLIKTNSGFWAITGNSTYHSNTFVSGGTLMLMGSGAIPNSPLISINGATFVVSNTMSNPNIMFVTNFASLVLTNTAVTASPLTIGTLTVSNAMLHLGVNGASPYTDIAVSTSLTTGPGVTLAIDKLAGVSSATTFTLISYAGADPDPATFNVTLASAYLTLGYTVSGVTVGGGAVTVTVTPPTIVPLVWVGATNSVLVSNWDTNKTKNWLDQASLSTPQVFQNLDPVLFDDTASTNVVTLITTNAPDGITVNNSTLNYVFNGGGKITGAAALTKQGGATLTLAGAGGNDFSGGIVVQNGLLVLDDTNSAISGGLTVSGGATAQVGRNDAGGALPAGLIDDEGALIFNRAGAFVVSTAITGGGEVTQTGNGTLTLNVSNSYTGGTVVGKGTLALAGSGSILASSGLLISNATFDVSGIPAKTNFVTNLNLTNAIINVGPTNLQTPIYAQTFVADGIVARSNLINVLALPPIANYPATIALIQSASPITLTGGNFNFALGSLPAGSPAYAANLAESADQTAILLTVTAGPVGVRGSVNWVGTINVTATTNWSDSLNWQLPGAPGAADNVVFGNAGTGPDTVTVNNEVNGSYTISSLTYSQNGASAFHVTDIPAGQTLTVSGNVTVGGLPSADGTLTPAYMTGGGTFTAGGSLFSVNNLGVSAGNSLATLDLTGLSFFNYNNSAGTMNIANASSGNRFGGLLRLAGVSNNITVGTISFLQTAASNGGNTSSGLQFGAGTNNINVSTFNIVEGKNSGTVKFITGAPSTAGLRLRGVNGNADDSSRAAMAIGIRNTTGTGTTAGTLSLNGNPVDIKLSTLSMGQDTQSGGNAAAGTLSFDTGIVDVTSITMGNAGNAAVTGATGTINVGAAATLLVGAGGISLVNQTAGVGSGNLNITGGTVISSNSIIKTTVAGTGNVSITDGTLKLLAGTVGTLAAPIDTLTLSDNGSLDTKIQLNVAVGITNIAATSVNVSGTTTININSLVGVTGTTQIPLLSYTGGSPIGNLALGTIPTGYTGGSLVDSGTTIDLVITPPAPTVWKGAVGSTLNSSWDTGTLNWLNGATPVAYADIDFVQFDDTASTNVATLTATRSPASLNVNNNVLNYTFNGGGKISGAVALVKQGTGRLTLDNSGINDFTGGINIAGGSVQVGNNDANGNLSSGTVTDNGTLIFNRTDSNTVANAISGSGAVTQNGPGINKLTALNTYSGTTLISSGMIIATAANSGNSSIGSVAGAVIITNGGTLDIENTTAQALSFTNTTDSGGKPFFIAGTGVGGNGAIVNNGTVNQQNAIQNLTLTANATVGGPARWDLRVPDAKFQPVLDLGGYTLTKTGTNQMSMVALIVTNGGSIVINNGIFSFETISSNATTAITVNAGGVLGHYREQATLFTAPITLNGGMIRDLNGAPGSTNDAPITLTANSFLDLNVGSTDLLRLNGAITESGGSFGLTKTNIGSFSLSGTNTYSGTTLVAQGHLILVDNGSITNSKTITVAAGATLDASARVDGTLALSANQTLNGSGAVTGVVTTASSTVIAPGTPASIGTLTMVGNVTLSGTNAYKLNRTGSAANDVLAVNGALHLGGALTVTVLAGTPAANDSYPLFTATGGISGSFAATNLPALSAGLGWVTTNLANGILSIVATVNTAPTNITAVVSGNVLTLSWPADHTGWRLQAQTNSLSTGLNTNWADVAGSTTVNSENVTLDPANGTVFYRMVYP